MGQPPSNILQPFSLTCSYLRPSYEGPLQNFHRMKAKDISQVGGWRFINSTACQNSVSGSLVRIVIVTIVTLPKSKKKWKYCKFPSFQMLLFYCLEVATGWIYCWRLPATLENIWGNYCQSARLRKHLGCKAHMMGFTAKELRGPKKI